MALLTGSGPVSKLSDYQKELNTYAKGRDKFFCTLQGYSVQNQDEVVEAIGYQPEADLYNTSDSVFCAHGAGYLVPWYEVKEHMHMPICFRRRWRWERRTDKSPPSRRSRGLGRYR
ncbi:MAG: hypothetical protein ACLVG5_00395 [Clostridium sp.]